MRQFSAQSEGRDGLVKAFGGEGLYWFVFESVQGEPGSRFAYEDAVCCSGGLQPLSQY
jgi:hypothetical protein